MPVLDSINWTANSESSPRNAAIDRLQVHHATTTSLAGLRALMSPGGRTVSANGAMGNDGHLMGVVPWQRRAFTSASAYDHRSYTIEVCNTTLGPSWGISPACHTRLAHVAVDMHKDWGLPLDRAHIIGHNEVPGSYATACPGPSMNLGLVVALALQMLNPPKGLTRVNNFDYIHTIEGGVEYAVIAPEMLDNGYDRSTDLKMGEVYSILSVTGAPRTVTRVQFEACIVFGKKMSDAYARKQASVEVGSIDFPSTLELGPTSLAALANVEAAVNRLNPPG